MVADAGTILPVRIEEEMRTAYLDYAMSVIVGRAFPDVRDGLKPVQRRILYAMWDGGSRASNSYRKSAHTVGNVLGNYHPHGEGAVYDAMVRLAQPFSLRYPLVDGQGNFGSVDDDPPAAMRYTEARLSRIAEELIVDIDRDTVNFVDNFDGEVQEPSVLPGKLPNLLLNGAEGIAVGMATKIPPHNLREIVDAIVHLIDYPDATMDDLLRFVHGPDFPTAGTIIGRDGIRSAYATGHGRIVMRAYASIEEARDDRFRFLVTELPYQVNKAALQEKIAELVHERKIDGIAGMRDESDRQGMRLVIDLRRDAKPQQVLNQLYKHTAMQSAFNVNMLALVDQQPRVLTLKMALQQYIEWRREVVTRRTAFDLRKARERAHILEGLQVALDNLDFVVALIRGSRTTDAARQGLMARFGLSESQANAILEMQLRRLVALERQRILDELAEARRHIAELEDILARTQRVLQIIKDELGDLRERFGDDRRTRILAGESSEFSEEDLIPDEDVVVMLSDRGYVKRMPAEHYRPQRRGGKGVIGIVTRETDAVQQLMIANLHDYLLFFTDRGRVLRTKVHELPDASRQARGAALINFIGLDPDESVTSVIPIRDFDQNANLVFATRGGELKRTAVREYDSVRQGGIKTMDLAPGDELGWAVLTDGDDDVIMVTERGQGIRMHESEIRVSGRTSGGVRGIKLIDGDPVAGLQVIDPDGALVMVTNKGFGKKTRLSEFSPQQRAGTGMRAALTKPKTGRIVAARVVGKEDEEILVISGAGIVLRVPLDNIKFSGRQAQGATLMHLNRGDSVVAMAVIAGEQSKNGQ